jgi:putative chitinase
MKPANPAAFFDVIRTELFHGSMTPAEVDGTNAILAAWPDGTDARFVAYALATAFHETDFTMEPIPEWGRGRGRPYGVPCGPYGHVYYGRGLIQLTWLKNYERAEREIPGSDLVRTPDNALKPNIAAEIMIRGMSEGWFTGKKLADYFTDAQTDWVNARKIINGLDKAAQIAAYASHFWHAVNAK